MLKLQHTVPAGFNADPVISVDPHRWSQNYRFRAEVVGHLDTSVHDGQRDVVRALHALPAPQEEAVSGLSSDAQLKLVHQQGFLATSGRK